MGLNGVTGKIFQNKELAVFRASHTKFILCGIRGGRQGLGSQWSVLGAFVFCIAKSKSPLSFAQIAKEGWGTRFDKDGVFPLSTSGFLALAFQGALEGLVQGGLGFFVFLLADAALFVFDFEFEQLIL